MVLNKIMIQTITTALSALAGGFIGAYFTRQSQHHKWILERRAESFATFLQMLSEARSAATDLLYDETLSKSTNDLNIRLSEAYMPALNYAQIVKLYLPKALRQEFYNCAKNYSILHTLPNLGDNRLGTMEKRLNRIQEIFEQELSAYFWILPIFRKIKHLTNYLRGTG